MFVKIPTDLFGDERMLRLVTKFGMRGVGAVFYAWFLIRRRNDGQISYDELQGALKVVSRRVSEYLVEDSGFFVPGQPGMLAISPGCCMLSCACARDPAPDPAPDRAPDPAHDQVLISSEDNSKDLSSSKEKDELDRIRSYLTIEGQSSWQETILMQSGYGELLKVQWHYALKLFLEHIVAECRTERCTDINETRSYFRHFLLNPITGPRLYQLLKDHEMSFEPDDADPYRFEDRRTDGRRFVDGRELPNDAPPRPSRRHFWNYALNCWEE